MNPNDYPYIVVRNGNAISHNLFLFEAELEATNGDAIIKQLTEHRDECAEHCAECWAALKV